MKKNVLKIMFAALLSASALASCNQAVESVTLTNPGVLVVGMECGYAPFNWTETSQSESNVAITGGVGGYAEGYDVQVAKILASEMGLELQIKAIEWKGLVPALQNNMIDAIIAGMSPTEDRKLTIDFTNGYYKSTHVLLVKKDSNYASATSLDDFNGANIIGQTGTIYADLIPQVTAHGAIAKTNLDTVPEIVNAIVNGNIDTTILEEPVAMGICSQYSQLSYVKIDNAFEVNEEDVLVSIGVRKGFDLTNKINEVLASITEERRATLMEQAINLAPSAE